MCYTGGKKSRDHLIQWVNDRINESDTLKNKIAEGPEFKDLDMNLVEACIDIFCKNLQKFGPLCISAWGIFGYLFPEYYVYTEIMVYKNKIPIEKAKIKQFEDSFKPVS